MLQRIKQCPEVVDLQKNKTKQNKTKENNDDESVLGRVSVCVCVCLFVCLFFAFQENEHFEKRIHRSSTVLETRQL